MTRSFDHILTKRYANTSITELLDAPPDALKGVSAADARHLAEAFGIESIRELAESRFFARAQAILAAAGTPSFDPGPPGDWDAFFQSAPLAHYVEHPARRFRLDFGPVYYRGRLDGTARVLVLGQDPSTNEILGHRVFLGRSGQRVQGFLARLGITRSYVMLNTFLYSVFGQFDAELQKISLEPRIRDYRNRYLDRLAETNPLEAIITIGAGARHAADHWPGGDGLARFDIVHPAAPEPMVLSSWNHALPRLQRALAPDEDGTVVTTLYGDRFQPDDQVAIPRFDLPFGVPRWHGRDGGCSHRDGNKNITWTAP